MPRFLLVMFAFEFICSLNDKVLSIVTPRYFSGVTVLVPSSKISFVFILYSVFRWCVVAPNLHVMTWIRQGWRHCLHFADRIFIYFL